MSLFEGAQVPLQHRSPLGAHRQFMLNLLANSRRLTSTRRPTNDLRRKGRRRRLLPRARTALLPSDLLLLLRRSGGHDPPIPTSPLQHCRAFSTRTVVTLPPCGNVALSLPRFSRFLLPSLRYTSLVHELLVIRPLLRQVMVYIPPPLPNPNTKNGNHQTHLEHTPVRSCISPTAKRQRRLMLLMSTSIPSRDAS